MLPETRESTRMASPQCILDDLVELFHSDEREPVIRHAVAVTLVQSLSRHEFIRSETLVPLFRKRQSDLLADFAGACDVLPRSSAQEYKAAFGQAIEWMRCYFDSASEDPFLLEQSSTRSRDRQLHSEKVRTSWRFPRAW